MGADASGAVRAGAVLLSWLTLGLIALGAVLALFGLPYRDFGVYVAHAAAFVLGPGAVSYLWAADRPVPPLTLLTQGFCLGLCLETLTYLALLMAGHPALIVWYPLPFALLLLSRGPGFLARVDWSRPTPPIRAFAVLAVVLLVVFTTGVEVFDPVLNHHATWPVAYARAGLSRWPLPDPFTLGESVHYHYLYYLHFSAATLVTGQSLTLLVTRSAVPMALAVLVLLLYDLASAQTRRPWLALLVPLQVLVTVGYASPVLFGWFGHVIAASSFHVPATLASHLVFFALLRELDTWLTTPRVSAGRLATIAVMILAASGLRSSVLPVLGAAVALLILPAARERKVPWRLLLVFGLILGSFAWGLYVFFGFGGDNDATGVLRLAPFAPGNASDLASYRWLVSWLSPRTAAGLTLVGAQIARMTFLLPGLVLFLVLWARGAMAMSPLRYLVVGAWVSGLSYVLLFWSSHGMGAFTQFGAIGAALFAVAALDVLLDGERGVRLRIVAATSVALFALHTGDVVATVRSELGRQSLASRNQEPAFFEPESDLAPVARFIREGAFENTLFVVSGRSAGCRGNAELRLAAAEPRFRLLASSHILRGYTRRRGVGEALLEKADLLRRLGGPPENRWAAVAALQRLVPAGQELAVLDCGGGRALSLLPPGATVRLASGSLNLLSFPRLSP